MEVQTKLWRINLDFGNRLTNLSESVNGRNYYDLEMVHKVIKFYMESGLLKSNVVEISEYNVDLVGTKSIKYDKSNNFSF